MLNDNDQKGESKFHLAESLLDVCPSSCEAPRLCLNTCWCWMQMNGLKMKQRKILSNGHKDHLDSSGLELQLSCLLDDVHNPY